MLMLTNPRRLMSALVYTKQMVFWLILMAVTLKLPERIVRTRSYKVNKHPEINQKLSLWKGYS